MKPAAITLEQARALHQAGDTEAAKAAYKNLLIQDPQQTEALHALGIINASEKNFNAALDYLNQALLLQPNNPVIHLHLANILKIQKQYPQASAALHQLIKLHPTFAPAYNNLGTIFYAENQLDAAIAQYQIAIEKQPEYIDAYYNLGLAQAKQNKFAEAVQTYTQLLNLESSHFAARFHLACALLQQNKITAAEKEFLTIAESHPDHYETQINLANCFIKQGALSAAKKHYLNALEINQQDAQVLFNLGVINMNQGHLDLAIQNYQRAIQIEPNNFEAHNNLGVAFLSKPHVGLALHHFEEALRIKPKNLAIKYTVQALAKNQRLLTAPPDYITALFDAYADHYDAHLVEALDYQIPNLLFNALNNVTSLPKQKWDILDLGCGTGLSGIPFKSAARTLTGVDLSTKMLEVAAQKQIYTELIPSDLTTALQNKQAQYDLIIAGDVLVYIGELKEIFANCSAALKEHGFFIFNAEISDDTEFKMNQSGRFAHQKNYLDQLAAEQHFKILSYQEVVTRLQNNTPVYGHLYVLQKAALN